MKKLSIIIPIYNTEKFLNECLDSILNSKKIFEVILVDDGSTDSSGKICDEYNMNDERIRVIHKKNGGVSSARNLGIDEAKGDYIMFVDSDDLLSSEWDNSIDFLKNDDIYYFDNRIDINVSKEELLKYIIGNNKQKIYISGPFIKAFKTKFLIKNKLHFDEQIINGEDMLFNVETLLLSKTFSVIHCYFYYYYRQVLGQSTRRFDKKIIDSDEKFHKKLNLILEKYNETIFSKEDLKNHCLSNAIMLIINRISYIDKYVDAENYFAFINSESYNTILKQNEKIFKHSLGGKILLYCYKKNDYRMIYYFLRMKNKLHLYIKKIKKGEFIKI